MCGAYSVTVMTVIRRRQGQRVNLRHSVCVCVTEAKFASSTGSREWHTSHQSAAVCTTIGEL